MAYYRYHFLLHTFITKTIVDTLTDCIYFKNKSRNIYPTIGIDGKNKQASRVFYELFRNKIPKYLEPDHICENKACINPYHLDIVTHAENMRRISGRKQKHPRRGRLIRRVYYLREKK